MMHDNMDCFKIKLPCVFFIFINDIHIDFGLVYTHVSLYVRCVIIKF